MSKENLETNKYLATDRDDQAKDTQERVGQTKGLGFFERHRDALEDYASDSSLSFSVRNIETWQINLERGQVIASEKWFRDLTDAEAMFGAMHEIEHFRELIKDPKVFRDEFGREKFRPRLQILHNCLDDILVNRELLNRAPAHQKTLDYLYNKVLFPERDFTSGPKHLQFVYALLIESLQPDESAQVSDDAREEIEKLRNFEETDLVDLINQPGIKPEIRAKLIRKFIEPVYERLFQEDVEEKKKNGEGSEKGKGDKGDEGAKPTQPEDYFGDEYDDYEQKFPKVVPDDQLKEELDKVAKRQKEEQESSEERARKQFEQLQDVSIADIESYRQDYQQIEKYIEPLRQLFEQIISRRKEVRRRLKKITDEGVVIKPTLLPQAYIDTEAGVEKSRTQVKYESQERDWEKPKSFELTLVCDLSGSMEGEKLREQRLSAVLIMEALREFEEKLAQEREEKTLDLAVQTELRAFSDADMLIKPLSHELTQKDRVKMHEALQNAPGNSTPDYASLEKISAGISEDKIKEIQENDLKKIVIILTDGGSSDKERAKKAISELEKKGVILAAIGIGEAGSIAVEDTYGKYGKRCDDVSRLTKALRNLLEDYLRDL